MTGPNLDLSVHYVTRVEGHGNIVVNARNGRVERCEWEVPEAPRFFEAMVIGRRWDELHHIVSRICGICSIGHTLASLKATEAAMGVEVSEQDLKLRRLALHGENMQSHILHIGYLALPDLLGVGSVVPLATRYPEELRTVIRLHRLANEMSDLVSGRTTHPQRLIPGGFSKIPTMAQLAALRDRLRASEADIRAVAALLEANAHRLPDFTRETEFVSLTHPDEYALYDGELASTDTGTAPVDRYLEWTNEYLVPRSTAKYTKHARASYMVGALARLNNNFEQLTPLAKEVAGAFGLRPVCHNPYMNTVAQLIEVAHSVEDSIRLIDEIESEGLRPQPEYHRPAVEVRAGRGISAVEVPRGVLFHDYTYDGRGVCTAANCVIPTNQNHGNIQLDMEALVPRILDRPREEIELTLEMLVRSYDPCISCSTHYLKVTWT